MESRDLSFDLSPAQQRLAEAREIANDPTARYDEWRRAYLLVQQHDIWEGGGSCATSTAVGPEADGAHPGVIAAAAGSVTAKANGGTNDEPFG